MQDPVKYKIAGGTGGRALFIAAGGRCYISRRYQIFRSDDWGQSWQLDCRVPASGWKSYASLASLGARLLRYYIGALQVLGDGSRVAVARDGLYRAGPGESQMTRTFKVTRGSRPLHLGADGTRLLFGEYGDGYEKTEVLVYVSEDSGRSWDVAYRFPAGDIRHVHNIVHDPWNNHYWIMVGDFGHQPGIGALSKDLRNIDWVVRGNQESRVVSPIVNEDNLVYGMDSDYAENFIVRLDKQSGKMTKLLKIEGSSLYSARFGSTSVISTCVEKNPACPSRECSLYLSRDGDAWNRIETHQKDWYNYILFQFGTLVLPYVYCDRSKGMYSGQAVVGGHNSVRMLDFDADN
jgi:hypothetical protein